MKRFISLIALISLLLCGCAADKGTNVIVNGSGEEAAVLVDALTAMVNCDDEGYLAVFPPKMSEYYKMLDVYSYFFSLKDMKAWLENSKNTLILGYGENIKIRGELSESMETTVDALGDANLDYYTYMRYVTPENTEAVRTSLFVYTIEGANGKEEKEAMLYFVKQEGKWYLHPCFAFYSF